MENTPVSGTAGTLGPDDCHLRVPSAPEWVESTVDYLVRRAKHCGAVAPTRANKLMMAFHEALTNSVIHGNLGISSVLKEQGDEEFARAVTARCADPAYARRLVDIRATFDGQSASWTFTDEGEGFDADAALRRLDDEPDPLKPSGRGLVMIRAFVDEMRYDLGGRRLVLTIGQPAAEKRQHERLPVTRGVRVAPIGADGQVDFAASREGLTLNISPEGVGLIHPGPGGQARVMITIPTEQGAVSVPAEVRHWHAVGEGVVEVGCRFEAPAPVAPAAGGADALVQLVERLGAGQLAHDERRAAMRVAYTECIGVEVPGGPTGRGFARDLSRLGIAFFTTEALPLGVVQISLPQRDGVVPIHVRAHVVRCTRLIGGFYDVAARFLPG